MRSATPTILLLFVASMPTLASAQSHVGRVSMFDTEQHVDGKLIFKAIYLFAPQGVVFGLVEHPSEHTSYGLYGMTAMGNVRIQWFTLKGTGGMSEPSGAEILQLSPKSTVQFQIIDHTDKQQIKSVTSAARKPVSQKLHDVWFENANSFLRKLSNDKIVAKQVYDVETNYKRTIHLRGWKPNGEFAKKLGVAPSK